MDKKKRRMGVIFINLLVLFVFLNKHRLYNKDLESHEKLQKELNSLEKVQKDSNYKVYLSDSDFEKDLEKLLTLSKIKKYKLIYDGYSEKDTTIENDINLIYKDDFKKNLILLELLNRSDGIELASMNTYYSSKNKVKNEIYLKTQSDFREFHRSEKNLYAKNPFYYEEKEKKEHKLERKDSLDLKEDKLSNEDNQTIPKEDQKTMVYGPSKVSHNKDLKKEDRQVQQTLVENNLEKNINTNLNIIDDNFIKKVDLGEDILCIVFKLDRSNSKKVDITDFIKDSDGPYNLELLSNIKDFELIREDKDDRLKKYICKEYELIEMEGLDKKVTVDLSKNKEGLIMLRRGADNNY